MIDLNTLSKEQLVELVAKMQADSQRKLSCKVSEKGAISVYGLGRFPVTLYSEQWERLGAFVKSGAIDRFAQANAALLSTKADKQAASA